MTLSTKPPNPELLARRRRTVVWVVGLGLVGMIFDGYDLVVYGAVVPTFLRDPSQIGKVSPQMAGALGSYAMIGMLVGSLLAGAVADIVGRRKVLLVAYGVVGVGMSVTALTNTTSMFGMLRFLTGLGVGAVVVMTGTLVTDYAPQGKKNLAMVIAFAGQPVGSLLAALLAILLLDLIGWRGMFWIGALPLVTILPLAFFKMPESVAWLAAAGRHDRAREISERTGVPIPYAVPSAPQSAEAVREGRAGFAGLFNGTYIIPTVLFGFVGATGLLLVYSLNTWLPELMRRAGFEATGSLSFLLVLNGGAIVGSLIASRVADRLGPKPVVAACFLIGAVVIALLTLSLPMVVLLLFVALAGLGTTGTQILIYGFVANYYRTNVRGAAVAWCAGFGRLGGVGGPLLGGFLIGAGLAIGSIFYILAGACLLGLVLTLLVPTARGHGVTAITIEPAKPGEVADVSANP